MATRRRAARTRGTQRYVLESADRLLVRRRDALLRPAQVLKGYVTADRRNRLVYRVTRPPEGARAPRRITLRGTWGLTPAHELTFRVRERARSADEPVALGATLAAAEAGHAIFAAPEDAGAARSIRLTGRWQVDAGNRLTFLAEQAEGAPDRLTVQGGWELGPHHELRYRFRRRSPRREARDERVLTFRGRWDLGSRHALVYRLDRSTDDVLELRARIQGPRVRAADGRLAYQVGVAGRRGRTRTTRLVFFGRWLLGPDGMVSFEMPVRDGRREAFRFGGTLRLSGRRELAVRLTSQDGAPLGVTVVFRQRLGRDTEWFLRLRKAGRETEVLGGVRTSF